MLDKHSFWNTQNESVSNQEPEIGDRIFDAVCSAKYSEDIRSFIVKNRSLLHETDDHGRNALHWSAITHNYKLLQDLLALSSPDQLSIKDKQNNTPVSYWHKNLFSDIKAYPPNEDFKNSLLAIFSYLSEEDLPFGCPERGLLVYYILHHGGTYVIEVAKKRGFLHASDLHGMFYDLDEEVVAKLHKLGFGGYVPSMNACSIRSSFRSGDFGPLRLRSLLELVINGDEPDEFATKYDFIYLKRLFHTYKLDTLLGDNYDGENKDELLSLCRAYDLFTLDLESSHDDESELDDNILVL
ncbi:MAG: hypothetical protein VX335_04715 [Pseudomonadota bacterium]|nr:hypothetical protein [Pseudomonadota bacterium]